MKTVNYTIKEERYFDCPHCNELLSDEINVAEIVTGLTVECSACEKKILIGGEE